MKVLKKNGSIILLFVFALLLTIYTNSTDSNYTIKVVNTALLNAMVAYGLSLMLGIGGQLVFCGVTFMGIGAYTTANLLTGRLGFETSSVMALLISFVISAILAFAFGILFMRLKEVFCTFATLGLVNICFSLFSFYEPLFGKPDGISGISTLTVFGYSFKGYKPWYYLLLTVVVVIALIMEQIRRSRFGRSLAAIRDDEVAAQTLGINVYWTRVFAFVIASLFAGVSGSLFAMHNKFIFGNSFSFTQATNILVMSMLGGINSTPGILIGAILVTFLPEVLRDVSSNLIMLIYGVLVILLMIFMPMGIGGLFESGFKWVYHRSKKKSAKTVEEGVK